MSSPQFSRQWSRPLRPEHYRAERALGITIDVTVSRASHYAEETGAAYWLTRADLRYAETCATDPATRDEFRPTLAAVRSALALLGLDDDSEGHV